jgi:hypothetical protein
MFRNKFDLGVAMNVPLHRGFLQCTVCQVLIVIITLIQVKVERAFSFAAPHIDHRLDTQVGYQVVPNRDNHTLSIVTFEAAVMDLRRCGFAALFGCMFGVIHLQSLAIAW